ncbi:MAG: radical SAM protein [Planctomycetota bacterium]|nr:MAG: radical SAM protein [Planctomycetota bacterium]
MDIILLSPPVANFGQCSSGLSVLTAYLRHRGWDAHQWDLAIDAFHHFHSPEYLSECLRRLEGAGPGAAKAREVARRVIVDIEAAKDALRRPGVERDTDTMRWAFETINDAGIVMTAASLGAFEHDFRHFGIRDAFRSYESLGAAIGDPERNPFLDFFREHALPRLIAARPRAVGLSLTYFSQVLPGLTLARLIKAALPETHLILGGAYLTATEHDTETIPCELVPADAIILHDGEEGLDQWLSLVLRGEGAAESIANCYLPAGRTFRRAGARNIAHTDLARLPSPLWIADGLELDKYLVPKYPIPLPLSRGCYWGRCNYCNISCQTVALYRTRPPELALEDMRAAIAETGSNWFDFPVDSYRPKELHALARAVIDAGLDIEWGAEVLLDPGFLREGVVADLARSGCRTLRFGLESACEETLQAMNKPTRPKKARRLLGLCKQHGIQTACMLIAGYPTETQRQLYQTYDYLVENSDRIDFLTIHQYSLVHGSPMAQDPAAHGLIVLPQEAVLWTSIPFQNTNPVGMRNEDLPEVVEAMKEGLKEHYPDLGELWTVAIGGWMTFPACCGVRRELVHPVGGG